MSTIVGILTFMSRKKFHAQLSWAWNFYNLGVSCVGTWVYAFMFAIQVYVETTKKAVDYL